MASMLVDLTPKERKFILSRLRLETNAVHNLARWHLEHERGDRTQAGKLQRKFDWIAKLIEKVSSAREEAPRFIYAVDNGASSNEDHDVTVFESDQPAVVVFDLCAALSRATGDEHRVIAAAIATDVIVAPTTFWWFVQKAVSDCRWRDGIQEDPERQSGIDAVLRKWPGLRAALERAEQEDAARVAKDGGK